MTKIVLCFQRENQNVSRKKPRRMALVKVFKMKSIFSFLYVMVIEKAGHAASAGCRHFCLAELTAPST